MYNAVELSKYIVSRCAGNKYPISNLQLQKILYYIQREYISRGNQAFSDDIEAWRFGPVVPNVYYYFCGYGAMPIDVMYESNISSEDQIIMDPIIDSKSKLNPWDLVADTHYDGGAWSQVFKEGDGNKKIIPIELIKEEVGLK